MKLKIIIAICLLVIATNSVFGQNGALDNSFGTGGINTTSVANGYIEGNAVALQPDGKILVVGNFSYDDIRFEFALIRYNTNGSVDTTFGIHGIDTTVIDSFNDEATSLAIQKDGKILVAGISNDSLNNKFALVRYNQNGSLDTTFGEGGKVTTGFGNSYDNGNAMALQSDGKIVVAGSASNDSTTQFAVARYNSSGVVDSTFGNNGLVTTSIGELDDEAFTLAIQPDKKIVVAGSSLANLNYDFSLVRYDSIGIIDSSFGTNGRVTTDIEGYDDFAYSLVLQSDKKIVIAGKAFNGITSVYSFATVRYNTNGTLDASFSRGGIDTTTIGGYDDEAQSVAVQADGKIVVAGFADINTKDEFAVVRYNSNGSFDTTSNGGNGKVTTAIDSVSSGASVVIQPDGKIVVAGYAQGQANNYYSVGIVRYLNSLMLGIVDLGKANNSVLIYPNPIHDVATLDFKLAKSENLSINLFDLTGRLVQSIISDEKMGAGEYQQRINIETLPQGEYILRFENSNSQSISIQIVKQ